MKPYLRKNKNVKWKYSRHYKAFQRMLKNKKAKNHKCAKTHALS